MPNGLCTLAFYFVGYLVFSKRSMFQYLKGVGGIFGYSD